MRTELDGLHLFLRDLHHMPPLTADEEARLLAKLARHRADHDRVRNRLVEGLQGMVIHLA